MRPRLTTLLAEEVRDAGRNDLLVLAVLATTCVGVQAILAVPALFGASTQVLASFTLLLALLSAGLAAPVVVVSSLARYWSTMYGRRGYLTMSLPVRGRVIVAAKALYALGATAVALAATALETWATVRIQGWVPGGIGAQVAQAASARFEALPPGVLTGIIAFSVLNLACLMLIVMAVMSLAAQVRFSHMGLAAVLIGLVIVYLVDQVVRIAATFLVPIGLDLTSMQVVIGSVLAPTLQALRAGTQPTVLGLGYLPCLLVETALMVWWGVRAVERHTSLR